MDFLGSLGWIFVSLMGFQPVSRTAAPVCRTALGTGITGHRKGVGAPCARVRAQPLMALNAHQPKLAECPRENTHLLPQEPMVQKTEFLESKGFRGSINRPEDRVGGTAAHLPQGTMWLVASGTEQVLRRLEGGRALSVASPWSCPAATRCWRGHGAAAGPCTSPGCPRAPPRSSSAPCTCNRVMPGVTIPPPFPVPQRRKRFWSAPPSLPFVKVLKGSSDRIPGFPDPHRLQHPRVPQLV